MIHGAKPLAQLLGGHVWQRPGGGHVPEQVLLDDGDAEVGQVGPPLGVDQDVGGLDVAMDEARLVGVREGVGDLGHDPGRLAVAGTVPLIRTARFVPSIHSPTMKQFEPSLPTSWTGHDVRVPEPRHLAGLDPALVHLAPGDWAIDPGNLHRDRASSQVSNAR